MNTNLYFVINMTDLLELEKEKEKLKLERKIAIRNGDKISQKKLEKQLDSIRHNIERERKSSLKTGFRKLYMFLMNNETAFEPNIIKKFNESMTENENLAIDFYLSESTLQEETEENIQERDLENLLYSYPFLIEENFKIIESQKKTPAGRIDLIGIDKYENIVIIESKKDNMIDDRVIGQISRYIGYFNIIENLTTNQQKKVRGIIFCKKASDYLKFAISSNPNISLIEYNDFDEIKLNISHHKNGGSI